MPDILGRSLQAYLHRKEFGLPDCPECGPVTEKVINHFLSDLETWLNWRRYSRPPESTTAERLLTELLEDVEIE